MKYFIVFPPRMMEESLCPQPFATVLPSLAKFSEACYIKFVTWPMTKTCVDESELVNLGAKID